MVVSLFDLQKEWFGNFKGNIHYQSFCQMSVAILQSDEDKNTKVEVTMMVGPSLKPVIIQTTSYCATGHISLPSSSLRKQLGESRTIRTQIKMTDECEFHYYRESLHKAFAPAFRRFFDFLRGLRADDSMLPHLLPKMCWVSVLSYMGGPICTDLPNSALDSMLTIFDFEEKVKHNEPTSFHLQEQYTHAISCVLDNLNVAQESRQLAEKILSKIQRQDIDDIQDLCSLYMVLVVQIEEDAEMQIKRRKL